MVRAALLLTVLLVLPSCFAQKGETPPYDPAPPSDRMSAYTNQELAFKVFYPKEFLRKTAEDLQTVMERGHRIAFGSDPNSDPEHAQAVRCMHTLFYATAGEASETGTASDSRDASPDSILVEDIDPTCMPKKPKGDKALTNLVGTVLNLPHAMQLVQQIWFAAGGNRRIHSGMAATLVTLGQPRSKVKSASPPPSVPLIVIAAGVEQKGHRILIVYLTGSSGASHPAVRHMSISFGSGRPVLLFPFLLERANPVR